MVDIASPPNTHAEIAIAAAEAGKHIFCEKPFTISLEEAERTLAAVQKAGVKHMLGFNYRRVPAIGLAKSLIESGRLGRIYHWRAVYLQDWIMNPEFPRIWKLNKAIAGSGPHHELNSHLIDLALHLVGKITSVAGMEQTFIKERPAPADSGRLETKLTAEKSGSGLEPVDVDDATLFLARFANQAVGGFESTRFAPRESKGARCRLPIHHGQRLGPDRSMKISTRGCRPSHGRHNNLPAMNSAGSNGLSKSGVTTSHRLANKRTVAKQLKATPRAKPLAEPRSPGGNLLEPIPESLFKSTERFYLDPNSPVPLYHQMEKIILDRIASQGAVGCKLPREMDLISIFGVSRATVKKTTDGLAAKGFIRRRRAVGTHIVSLGVTEDLSRLTSYSEQMANRGLNVSTEVLEVVEHLPPPELIEKLQLASGEETLCIRRLRGTGEVFPVVLLGSEIPGRFRIDPGEDFSGSLYNLLEKKYKIPIEWADETISASRASVQEANHLRIRPGDVVLIMERLTFTRDNRPLEFVRAVYRPEYYTFSVRLKR